MDAIIASIHHHLFRRLNVFLMSCSPAELIYASIQHYKFQLNLLYLQTVKKSNHLPFELENRFLDKLTLAFITMEHSNIIDEEFANKVFKNMMDLFFNPEIALRKEQGLLQKDFLLTAAQAILLPNGSLPIIRLNSEVVAEVKIKKEVNQNVENFWPSSEQIESIKIAEKEFLNCGHVTIILFSDGFRITFDFQYNKQTSLEHLKVAKDFLETSKFALSNSYNYAFVDNAFSTVELLAKTNLLLEANPNANSKTHSSIQTAFNLRFRNSQTPFEIERREILNRLSHARNNARYLDGKSVIKELELEKIYQTIENMYLDLSNRIN